MVEEAVHAHGESAERFVKGLDSGTKGGVHFEVEAVEVGLTYAV